MKPVFGLWCLIGIVWGQDHLRTCQSECSLDDEFVNDETTPEWDLFMDTLTDATFQQYVFVCISNPNQTVEIDYHSDLIWDLRFKIYSERQNGVGKTISDCYCDYPDCESRELRTCLAEARLGMKNEVLSVLQLTVALEVQKMGAQC